MPADGPVLVRDARAEERDSIRALTMRAYAQYANVMSPEAWAGLYEAACIALETRLPAHRFVAERAGWIVGSVMLFPPASDAYAGWSRTASWPELRLLAVSPEARGSGIGEALVAACVRRAREDGAATLGLHTVAGMHAANKLYSRFGFVRAPELDFQAPGAERVDGFRLSLAERGDAERQRSSSAHGKAGRRPGTRQSDDGRASA